MGHASRLVAVHSVLRDLGVDSAFFVSHEHRLISDYGFDQIVIPERSAADSPEAELKKAAIRKAVIQEVMEPHDVILHDVAIHAELYELGVAQGLFQGYIYRARKDQSDPARFIADRAPDVDVVYVLGKAGETDHRHGIRLLGVADVVRRRRGEKPIWGSDDDGIKVVVMAGGGGHADAEAFIDAAVSGVLHACAAQDLRATLSVITGPYFRGTVRVPPAPHVKVRVQSYLGPEYSPYEGTDAVVSQGGYNTVQELKLSGVRAVAVPGERLRDDQHARLSELDVHDSVAVSSADAGQISASLAKLLLSPAGAPVSGTQPRGAFEIAQDIVGTRSRAGRT
jgi:hypothetical protein